MKLVTVSILILGMVCSSTDAIAEGPIPFHALMQNAGAEPAAPPVPDAKSDAQSSVPHSAQTTHRTNGGRAMMVGGIVLLAVGAAAITVDAMAGATFGTRGAEGRTAAAYVGGFAAVGTGITLIVLGKHRRSAKSDTAR